MNSYDPKQRVVRSSDIPATQLQGETILLGLEQQSYFGLRATSQRIWQLLEQPHTLLELRDQLLREYAVEPQRCEHELAAFMQNLWQAQLIHPIHEAAGERPRA